MKIFAWDNGQGPWGKPKQQNRSSGPKRPEAPRGQAQPDLEDVVNQMAESLRGYWKNRNDGGGGFPGSFTWEWIVAGVVALWAVSGLFIVAPEEQGVVTRFGAYMRTAEPGLNYHAPWPLESVTKLPVTRVNLLEVGFRSDGRGGMNSVGEESLMLTGDQNIVDLAFTVNWRISRPAAYLFNVINPAQTLVDVAESVMRETIGLHPIDDALTSNKAEIQYMARTRMQQVLDYYGTGITVMQVALQQVNPPREVIDAFRDVQAANADKQRLINEARGYANQIVPLARGEAAKALQQAEGYKQAKVAEATGAAERFNSQVGAYQKAPAVTKDRLYLEAMQEVLQDTSKVVVTSRSGGNVLPFLPLDRLMNTKPAAGEGEAR